MTPLIISGHHTGTRQQHSRAQRDEAGAPPMGNPGLVTTKKEISVLASCESW